MSLQRESALNLFDKDHKVQVTGENSLYTDTHRQTDTGHQRQTDRQTDTGHYRKMKRQTDRQTDRQTCHSREMKRQTDRQTVTARYSEGFVFQVRVKVRVREP